MAVIDEHPAEFQQLIEKEYKCYIRWPGHALFHIPYQAYQQKCTNKTFFIMVQLTIRLWIFSFVYLYI